MKKKMWISLTAVLAVLGILFFPLPMGSYDDGGTREYLALTYRIVDWNRISMDGVYEKLRFYGPADRHTPLSELWQREMERVSPAPDRGDLTAKPVIYLYPEREEAVTVRLAYRGELSCTYPEYADGWHVTASPDGTLTDADGQTYSYLYWEGESDVRYDFSQGFCIRGEDTAAFLEDALAELGLNRREANEFIVYWLPLMQENPYNIIAFQRQTYTEAAQLQITPEPDTLIRVFMAWYAADAYTEIEPQAWSTPEREGFTAVEWGGTQVQGAEK